MDYSLKQGLCRDELLFCFRAGCSEIVTETGTEHCALLRRRYVTGLKLHFWCP
jgi:hypothetical protein